MHLPRALTLLRATGTSIARNDPMLHAGAPPLPHDLWTSWTVAPVTLAALGASAAAYVVGWRTIAQRADRVRGVAPWRAWAFAGGWLALFVALISPVDAVAEALFSVHMTQHLLLTAVAPPLLVLGEPLYVSLWALAPARRRALVRWWKGERLARITWRTLSHPVVAITLHLVAVAAWHVPRPYDAAVRVPALHVAEHISFLVTALVFWWLVAARGARAHLAPALAVGALFVVAMEGTILGALLTVARAPWYASHLQTTQPWGLSPLEDQQLAGLIMWVPAGMSYLVAAVVIAFRAFLQLADRRGGGGGARRGGASRRLPAAAGPA